MYHKYIKKSGYLNSTHGKIFNLNSRSELEALSSESCHGAGAKHTEVAGALSFDSGWPSG
jgi:hypothetical protein